MLTTPRNLTATRKPTLAPSSARLDYLAVDEWQQFVESHPHSTVFHHRCWIEAIQQHYGLELFIPCLRSGGEIQAAIPFLSTRSRFTGRKLRSLPFTDYLPILSRRPNAAEALASVLLSNHPPCESMSLRTDTPLENVPSTSHSVRHDVRLGASFEELCKSFKSSVHRNVQKAQRANLSFVARTDPEAMEQFYKLHVLTRRKLGVPVQPKRFFGRLVKVLLADGLGFVGLVHKAGQPVAGGVFLTTNQVMIYKYAASHPAALADRPNDWLVYNALRLASDEGYRAFDFGVSNRSQTGLRRFKCNWGAREIDVHSIQLVGCARTPLQQSPLLGAAGVLIRNSPPFVCRCLGEFLYRFAM